MFGGLSLSSLSLVRAGSRLASGAAARSPDVLFVILFKRTDLEMANLLVSRTDNLFEIALGDLIA